MAAKLRPRVTLPRFASSMTARPAEARGRQLQRLVGQRRRRWLSPSASIRQEGRHEPVRMSLHPGAFGRLRARQQAGLRSVHVGQ